MPGNGTMLSIDLGGTKIAAAVISAKGAVLSWASVPTQAQDGQAAVMDRIYSLGRLVVRRSGVNLSGISAVAIAVPGPLDMKRGIVTVLPNIPGWNNVPLAAIMTERFSVKAVLIHDAAAAALAEHRLGAGFGTKHCIYLTISTGIGGGIILNRELYQGTDGCAGEIGHMTIDVNGPKCTCGNSGCLESLASGTAMAREATRRVQSGETSVLASLLKEPGGITARAIGSAAKEGDGLAREVVAEAAQYLGVGLVNIVNIFNPEAIVLGGGVSKLGNMLLAPARKIVRERAFSLPAHTVRITRANLGDRAGVIGAAIYASKMVRKEAGK